MNTDGDGALQHLTGALSLRDAERMRASGQLVDLGDDDEIILTGLKDGMQSGAPSVVLGFRLPDGTVVVAQTSWRLFAVGFHQLAGVFDTPYPDLKDMMVSLEAVSSETVIVGDDEPRWMVCQVCGERAEFQAQSVPGSQPAEPMWWLHEHVRLAHPQVFEQRGGKVGIARCSPDGHKWEPLEDGAPIPFAEMCGRCGEGRHPR